MKMWSGHTFCVPVTLICAGVALAQNISSIWETTKDQQRLFTHLGVGDANVQFGNGRDDGMSGSSSDATIRIDETSTYQTIFGFGAALTDSSARTLIGLKNSGNDAYNILLHQLFDVSENASTAGINYIRVPIGATDFSANSYTLDDTANDTSLSSFSISNSPDDVFSVLQDIVDINPSLLVHLCPWSPPAWMKNTSSIDGGMFIDSNADTMARYLLKTVQGFQSKGFKVYAVSVQNEPQNSNPTLPSSLYPVSAHAAVAISLRLLLDSNGLSSVKIIAYEHNWDDAGIYATQLMEENGAYDAFSGAAFHCYGGDVGNQTIWHDNFPDKEMYFTECTGSLNSDWWMDVVWDMKNIFIGALTNWAQTGAMWNLALDSQGGPMLPNATSCSDGCRGVVSIDNTTVTLNQEYYVIAHASKAIQPVDGGTHFGKRIKVESSLDSLVVGAYSTEAPKGSRISLVVLNNGTGDVETTIAFQNKQASYSFPVGLTTLLWTASSGV